MQYLCVMKQGRLAGMSVGSKLINGCELVRMMDCLEL